VGYRSHEFLIAQIESDNCESFCVLQSNFSQTTKNDEQNIVFILYDVEYYPLKIPGQMHFCVWICNLVNRYVQMIAYHRFCRRMLNNNISVDVARTLKYPYNESPSTIINY
jgi:hypothetical protein